MRHCLRASYSDDSRCVRKEYGCFYFEPCISVRRTMSKTVAATARNVKATTSSVSINIYDFMSNLYAVKYRIKETVALM